MRSRFDAVNAASLVSALLADQCRFGIKRAGGRTAMPGLVKCNDDRHLRKDAAGFTGNHQQNPRQAQSGAMTAYATGKSVTVHPWRQ